MSRVPLTCRDLHVEDYFVLLKKRKIKYNPYPLTLDSKITFLAPLKYYVFKNIMENGAFAPFFIIFPKVFKSLLNFFLNFFQCCLKIENAVMI